MHAGSANVFLWSRWRRKRSRHSRCMRNPQFYVSGKRLISQGDHQGRNTFSAANTSSNRAWLLRLHDAIQMKSNYTRINYNHDNIAIRSHIMIYNCVWNLIFGAKFSSIYLAKGEKCLVFRLPFVNLQRAKDVTQMLEQNIDLCFIVQFSSNRTLRITPH